MSTLPLDIVRALIDALVAQRLFGTLASLMACNRTLFGHGTPALYRNIQLTEHSADKLFIGLLLPDLPPPPRPPASRPRALWPEAPLPLSVTDTTRPPRPDPSYPSKASHARKVGCLSYIQQLTLTTLPSYALSRQLATIQKAPAPPLLPNVQLLHFTSQAVWTLVDWHNAHTIALQPDWHPFAPFISLSVKPVRVIVDLPTLSPRRKVDWWNARYGPREDVGTSDADARRRHVLAQGWKKFTGRDFEKPMLGILLGMRPQTVIMRNIVCARGMVIPGTVTVAEFRPCQCRLRQDVKHCCDHVTTADRIKNVVAMCVQVEAISPEGLASGVELVGVNLSKDEQETRDMIREIKEGLAVKGVGRKLAVKFR